MAYLHKLVAGNDIVKLEDHWFEIYQSLLFENTSFKGFIAMFNDSFYQARKPLNSEILKNKKPSFCHTRAVVLCSSKSPGSECSTQQEQNKASQRSVSNKQQFSYQ